MKEKLLTKIIVPNFKDDVEEKFLKVKKWNSERDTAVLMRAVNIIKNEIFKKYNTFTGFIACIN